MKSGLITGKTKRERFLMRFEVRNIDVISRRNKINEPCVEDWRNYDQNYMETLMIEFGCHPPHWKSDTKLPICSNEKQMKYFFELPEYYDAAIALQPCKKIDRLDYTYTEVTYNDAIR